MALHENPVNEAREQRGEMPVNAVWLWGGGRLTPAAVRPFRRVRTHEPLAAGLALGSGAAVLPLPDDAEKWLRAAGAEGSELIVLDALRAPAAYGDAAAWNERLAALERNWFAPLVAALRSGRIGMVTVHVLGAGRRARRRGDAAGSALFLAPCPDARELRTGMSRIVTRKTSLPIERALAGAGVHPVLARLFASRGIRGTADLDCDLRTLIPPTELRNADHAAALLADHIAAGRKLMIVADYDCDGATACAVGVRALAAFGAKVDYFVPNRFETGYGLAPEVVDLVAPSRPDLLITVDNGIASIDGVERARALGIGTLITDHHLPGDALPAAECIVNPNQPGCAFPSKSIAGVGVMFYVMLALRAELRRRGRFAAQPEPNLARLLDLVALGTVADVVPLDRNNRVLVRQGLQRMRAGRMQPGIAALFGVAGRDPHRAGSFDLGFALGPRLNAAGPPRGHARRHRGAGDRRLRPRAQYRPRAGSPESRAP